MAIIMYNFSWLDFFIIAGKGKAPPPPPAPRLPPKDCPPPSPSSESSTSSSKSSESTPLNSSQGPSKTPSFTKNDIQTKILNSVRQKKDDVASPCKPAPKQPVKPSASLPALPPKIFVGSKTGADSATTFISEKHMKNKNNSSLHENLGLIEQSVIDQQLNRTESDTDKNRPSSLVSNSRPLQPPPPLKPKPKPRERPVPKRRVSVRNSSDSISEPKPSPKPLPPPPPPPIPKSPPPPLPKSPPLVPANNSIDTNNNNADSDCVNNDLSSGDDDCWSDFKHDSVSLRSLENAVLSITGWHESNNNNLNNPTETPSSPEITSRRPPIPVRDYNLRSSSIDSSQSCVSERSITTTTTTTTTVRTRSRSEIRSNLDRDPIHLPRKSRPATPSGIFSDILNQNFDTTKAPVRPPRPKHEEIKRTRSRLTASDIQFIHVDFTSSQQAHELGAPILPQQKTDTRKVCPPKPQRKSLVRRSHSDATDLREPSSHDIESDTRSQKLSVSSSPPSSPLSDRSDSLSKLIVPAPPKRWYPAQSNNSDDKSSLDGFTGVSNDHDYHEIIERTLFTSTTPVDSPQTASENSKEPTPPPILPPRNYTKEEEAEEATDSQNPPLPDRNYRDNSSLSSVQRLYVEMTGANGIDSSMLDANEADHDASLSHTRPLSSVSQSSLPSDSGSGSMETGNTNSVLTSGSESSEEEAESENEVWISKNYYKCWIPFV